MSDDKLPLNITPDGVKPLGMAKPLGRFDGSRIRRFFHYLCSQCGLAFTEHGNPQTPVSECPRCASQLGELDIIDIQDKRTLR